MHSLFGSQSGCLAAAYAIEKFFYNNGVLSNVKTWRQNNETKFPLKTKPFLITLSYPDRIVI